MNKTSLILLSILILGCSCYVHVKTVKASELLTNGDFETGDLTGWTTNGNPLAGGPYNRTGSYGCQITMSALQYHEYVEQTGFNNRGTAIAYMNFQSGIGGYYAEVFSVGSAPFMGFKIHSDSLYVYHGAGGINITNITFDQWYKLEMQVNATHIRWYLDGGLEHTGTTTVNMTRFRVGCSLGNPYAGHESWIDDCSLVTSAPPPTQPSDAPVVGPNPNPSQHRLWVTVFLNGEWVKGCNVTVKGGPDNSSVWTLTDLWGKAKFKVKSGTYEIEASYEQYRRIEPVDIFKATDIIINLSDFDYVRVAVPRVPDAFGWLALPELDLTTETLLFLLLPLIVLIIYAIKKATEGPQKRWKYSYLK